MCVNLCRVEALLSHEGFRAMRRALAFTTDTVEVDIIAHDMRDIDRHFLMREGGKAYVLT